MDLFDNMLSRLASGDASVVSEGVDVSEYIDPVYENEIMESTLPIGELIRSGEADNHAEILQALETFEMESILGSTKVIIEGSGQAGAAVVMEGVIKRFFDAIIERLKKIVNWFKGIFKKLFKKVDEKAAEGNIAEAAEHIEGRSKAAKNEGSLDKHLDMIREDAKKGVEAAMNFCGDNFVFIDYDGGMDTIKRADSFVGTYVSIKTQDVDKIIKEIGDARSNNDKDKDANAALKSNSVINNYISRKKDDNSERAKMIQGIFNKKGEDEAAVSKYTEDAFGIHDTSRIRKAETLPKAAEFAQVCVAVEKKTFSKTAKSIEGRATAEITRMINLCESAKNNYDTNNSFDKNATKALTCLITDLNSALAVVAGTTTKAITIVTNYASQYASIVNRAMSYKSNKNKNATTEGVEYMGFFMESDDVADVPEDPDEKDDDDDKGGKAATESYGGGTVSNDSLTAFMNSYM